MTPRRRAILLVALALLLIGVIIALVLLLTRKAPQPAAPAPAPTAATEPAASDFVPTDILKALAPQVAQAPGSTAAVQMAELFAERYGSYSNQGDFQNLKDLLPVMTSAFRARTEAYLATATASDVANYQGVTSVKIATTVRKIDDAAGTATIAVSLQQQKSSGASAAPTISYRSLKMTLKKVGSDWRVDSADWEN